MELLYTKPSYMNYWGWSCTWYHFTSYILWLKLSDSNCKTFLMLIKWYTIPSQIRAQTYLWIKWPIKLSVFEQKHRTNSTKCLVIILKVVRMQSLILTWWHHGKLCWFLHTVCFSRPAIFKLINVMWHMSPIAHRDSTRHSEICRT